jgi:hypothetical protein
MSFCPAILSLPLVVSALADVQPQNSAPCFAIYRNTQAGIAGALLLNKCTGQTWALFGMGPARWYPIPTSNEEYVAPPQPGVRP